MRWCMYRDVVVVLLLGRLSLVARSSRSCSTAPASPTVLDEYLAAYGFATTVAARSPVLFACASLYMYEEVPCLRTREYGTRPLLAPTSLGTSPAGTIGSSCQKSVSHLSFDPVLAAVGIRATTSPCLIEMNALNSLAHFLRMTTWKPAFTSLTIPCTIQV
jgi:hypothetical protein